MKNLKKIAILLIAIATLSCNKDDNNPKNQTPNVFNLIGVTNNASNVGVMPNGSSVGVKPL